MKKLSILKLLSVTALFASMGLDFSMFADGQKYRYARYERGHGPVVVGSERSHHKKTRKMKHKKLSKGTKAKGKHARSRGLLGRKGEEPRRYRPSHKRALSGKSKRSKMHGIKKHHKRYSARSKK